MNSEATAVRHTGAHGTVMPVAQRLASHTAQLLAGDAAARLLLFGTSAYLARTVSVELFGLLAFAQVLLGFLNLAADWGLGTAGIRDIARQPQAVLGISRELMRLRVGLAVLGTGVALVAVALSPWDDQTRLVVGATLLAAIPLAAVPDYAFRGLERMPEASAMTAMLPAFMFLGIILTVHGPGDVLLVPSARFGAATITAVSGYLLLRRGIEASALTPARPVPDLRAMRQRLQVGTVLLAANLAVLAHSNLDVVLVRGFLGDHAVGLYTAAYRIIQVPMGAFYALTAAALPVLVRSPKHQQPLHRWLGTAAGGAGIAIAVVIWSLRTTGMRLVYGEAYLPGASILGILAVAVPLDFVVAVKGTSYIARGWERAVLACVAGAAAINVVANLALIPKLGLSGAAAATLISYGVLLGSYVLWLDPKMRT